MFFFESFSKTGLVLEIFIFLNASFAEATFLQMIIEEWCLLLSCSVDLLPRCVRKGALVKIFLWGESGGRVLNQLFDTWLFF